VEVDELWVVGRDWQLDVVFSVVMPCEELLRLQLVTGVVDKKSVGVLLDKHFWGFAAIVSVCDYT